MALGGEEGTKGGKDPRGAASGHKTYPSLLFAGWFGERFQTASYHPSKGEDSNCRVETSITNLMRQKIAEASK